MYYFGLINRRAAMAFVIVFLLFFFKTSHAGPVHMLAYGDEASSFSGTVVLFALLHLIPILLAGAILKKRVWVVVTTAIMGVFAVFVGSPTYAFFDFIVVLIGGLLIREIVEEPFQNKSFITGSLINSNRPPSSSVIIDSDENLAKLTSKLMNYWLEEGILYCKSEDDNGGCWLWLHDVVLYESRNTGVFDSCLPFHQFEKFDRVSVWSGCAQWLVNKDKDSFIGLVNKCRYLVVQNVLPRSKALSVIKAYEDDCNRLGFWCA